MNTRETTLQGKHRGEASELYMAFELGEKNWKLSLGDGARSPSHYSVIAGDTAALLECIVKAKARCGLALEVRVHSCYEAGRDGFWVHRWLIEHGIDNIVVDSAASKSTAVRGAPRPTGWTETSCWQCCCAMRAASGGYGRWCGCPRRSKRTRGGRTVNWVASGKSAPLTSIGFVRCWCYTTCG